jgi:hypothetical protein
MLFKYIGQGDSSPKQTNVFGVYDFILNGDPVNVTADFAIKKLKGNSSFEIVTNVTEDTLDKALIQLPEETIIELEKFKQWVDGTKPNDDLKENTAPFYKRILGFK